MSGSGKTRGGGEAANSSYGAHHDIILVGACGILHLIFLEVERTWMIFMGLSTGAWRLRRSKETSGRMARRESWGPGVPE
jgi:hypothetical protein